MIVTNLILFGVLTSIVMFAAKTGIGCGFASLKSKEVVYIGLLYFILSILLSLLIERVPSAVTQQILGVGVAMHLVLAVGMTIAGLYTTRQWISNECDVSRRSFLWLSFPCPVCLTATFLACTILSTLESFSNLIIGFMVGATFLIVIIGTSIIARTKKKSPVSLGNAMMFIGTFYILSILVIPAYLQAKTVTSPSFTISLNEMAMSFLTMSVFIVLGFIMYRKKTKRKGVEV